jgi:hypothetical protein
VKSKDEKVHGPTALCCLVGHKNGQCIQCKCGSWIQAGNEECDEQIREMKKQAQLGVKSNAVDI